MLMVQRSRSKSGFTLVELLVVIAIIGILAAMLFPVIARARDSARAIACLSNTRQIASAVMMYTQDYDESLVPWADCVSTPLPLLKGCQTDAASANLWITTVQPYLKSTNILFDTSFNEKSAAQAMDEADCDGNGAPGSGSSGLVPADSYLSNYGLAYPAIFFPGCDTTGNAPYANYAASGWTVDTNGNYFFQVQTLAGIANAARTVILGDGAVYQTHAGGGVFTGSLFGCEARFRHRGGANETFADGHSKWISNNPEGHLLQDANGCYFEEYYTVDKE